MRKRRQAPTDPRLYQRRTERNLVIAVVVAFLVVGSLVISAVYGVTAAITGLMCVLPGVGIFVFLWGLLGVLEHLMRGPEE